MKHAFRFAMLLLPILRGFVSNTAMAAEQVPYQVERVELRSYGPVIVAETVIESDAWSIFSERQQSGPFIPVPGCRCRLGAANSWDSDFPATIG